MSDEIASYTGLSAVQPGLPSDYYLDAAHYQRELTAIWYRHWVYVCRVDALDGARAFRTIEIGSQNILVLRDEQGELQAFHNTCRHRGSILCQQKQGRLRSKSIVCPYHNWAYSLQGELQRTPSKHCPADFNKSDYPLYAVAVAQWQGCVFVNLAGEAALPFSESLQADSVSLDNWPMQTLKTGHSYRKVIRCNWKIFWENFYECLHCPGLHPELSKLVPIYSRAYMVAEDDPEWAAHPHSDDPKYTGGLMPGAQTWSFDGEPTGKPFASLSEQERKAGHNYAMCLPSLFIVAHVDYVRVMRVLPLGVDQTEIHAEWLFSAETMTDKNADIEKVAAFATLVLEQDAAACELNQQGLGSIRHKQGVLMAEEYAVYEFQEWVRGRLG